MTEKIAKLNEVVQAFANENSLEIGEIKLQKNGRIGASIIEKVETPDSRITSKDLANFDSLKEKNESVVDLTLGTVVSGYGSVKKHSNKVMVCEYMLVSGRQLARRDDVLVLERMDTGKRYNFTVDEFNYMLVNEADELTAGVINGTHWEDENGFIFENDPDVDLDEVEEDL